MRPTVIALAASLSFAPALFAAQATNGEFADQLVRYAADLDSYNRFYSLRWSEDLLDQREQFLRGKLAELSAEKFDALSQSGKVDYLLMRNDIRAAISGSNLQRRQLAEMSEALPFRGIIVALERARWKMEKLDPQAAASELAKIPELTKAVRERLDKGRKAKKDEAKKDEPKADEAKKDDAKSDEPKSDAAAKPAEPAKADEPTPIVLSPAVALRTARALADLDASLRRWYEYNDGYEPAFNWWCAKPYEEANKALDDLAKFLREELAGVKGKPEDPLVGDPIGRESLLEDLRNEFIALSPEELIAVGEAEYAWCEEQMKAAAHDMGLGNDWKAALAKVKLQAVPPGEQAEYVASVAREAIQFLKDRDLVTIPPLCEETWRLSMLSPQTQRTLPYAVYLGQAMGVAYPTSEMSHEDKLMSMRGNNRHFTRLVTPHELIPGHHLQGFYAQRENPHRRRFDTPFYVEGWALYWEMKEWDLDWAKTPEDRIGMLFWRMHRCARIMVSLKFHLGEMTPPQMIDYLVDRVGHERMGATSEVRRFIGGDYSPLYQCGYMIGGKQLRALWREQLESGKMKEKAFNDAVLKAGPIPIELLRAEMTGVPLTRDSEPTWRFDSR